MPKETWIAIILCAIPLYWITLVLLNRHWDRTRIRRAIETRGGTVLEIARAPHDIFVTRDAREYHVRYEEADGTPRTRTAVTTFFMGVAWRDPPPPATPERDSTHETR